MSSLACFVLLLSAAAGYYLPGVEPRNFIEYDVSKFGSTFFKVNSLTSSRNPIPYPHYSLPFCLPGDVTGFKDRKVDNELENLGEILWGDMIQSSPYYATMRSDVVCRKLCTTFVKKPALTNLIRRIKRGYRVNMILDNLPLASFPTGAANEEGEGMQIGVPVGTDEKNGKYKIYNHLTFTIQYHKPSDPTVPPNAYRIIGFFASPRSIKWRSLDDCTNSSDLAFPAEPLVLNARDVNISIPYSYQIIWNYTDREWKTRWEFYFHASDMPSRVHWFAITNSLLVVLLLSAIVALILLRTLHRDFNKYNDPDNVSEGQEETGWKLCHADVFRRPPP